MGMDFYMAGGLNNDFKGGGSMSYCSLVTCRDFVV